MTPTVIRCPNCRQVYDLASAAVERIDPTREGITEYGILCPHCQHFTHSFYMDEPLRLQRGLLQTAIDNYQRKPTPSGWEYYKRRQREYQRAHDRLNPKERAHVG